MHLFRGLKDGGDPCDGVDFIIQGIRRDGSFVEVLRGSTAERGWREVTADLSAFAGEAIGLKLVADVGPEENSTADWASWGEPVIRMKELAPTITVK